MRMREPLSRSDVARAVGVTDQAVSNWQRRHADFPYLAAGNNTGYPVAELAAWFDDRMIRKPDLRPGERTGSTYGDRFRKELGLAKRRREAKSAPGRPAVHPLEERVWAPLRLLHKGDKEHERFEAIVLGLLGLKGVDPRGWREDIANSPAAALQARITRVRDRLERDDLQKATAALDKVPSTRRWRDELHRIVAILSADETSPAQTFEFLLDRFAKLRQRSNDEYLTPAGLAALMAGLVDPRHGDRILDPCCGPGTVLVAVGRHLAEAGEPPLAGGIAGRAAVSRTWNLATLNLALHGTLAALARQPPEDACEVDAPPGRFDVVLLNPPFGRRSWRLPETEAQPSWPYREPSPQNPAYAWLQTVVKALAPRGRAVVVMPGSAMYVQARREHDIRARMIEDGTIRCVVSLPGYLFRETSSEVALWVLAHPEEHRGRDVLMVDARSAAVTDGRTHRVLTTSSCQAIIDAYQDWLKDPTSQTGERTGCIVTRASVTDIRGSGYDLRPSTYLESGRHGAVSGQFQRPQRSIPPGEPRWPHADGHHVDPQPQVGQAHMRETLIGEVPAEWEIRPLEKCCEIVPGPSGSILRASHNADGGIPVVRARDVTSDGILAEPAFGVSDQTADRLRRYRLKRDDIVLVRVGATTRLAVVASDQEGWLLGTSCIRIRAGTDIVSAYLARYLECIPVQEWLNSNTARGVIASITKKTIEDLPIVVAPTDVQRRVADAGQMIDRGIAGWEDAIRDAREARAHLLRRLISEV